MPIRLLVASLLATALSLAPSLSRADDDLDAYVISLPSGDTPRLLLPVQGWATSKTQRRADGSGVYHLLFNDASRLNLSVYVEQRNGCGTPAGCLESSLDNPAYKGARGIRRLDVGEFKAAQLFIDQPGVSLTQANLQASAIVDGIWFDVHISKVGATEPDMAPLVELLRSIRIARR